MNPGINILASGAAPFGSADLLCWIMVLDVSVVVTLMICWNIYQHEHRHAGPCSRRRPSVHTYTRSRHTIGTISCHFCLSVHQHPLISEQGVMKPHFGNTIHINSGKKESWKKYMPQVLAGSPYRVLGATSLSGAVPAVNYGVNKT